MNLYQLLILLSIYCSSTIVAVIAIPFFNKHSSSAISTSSSPTTHSSLLLQHHRTIYTNRRPHDTSLYDILNVKSNATLAEIQKSWRRKSLQWHPDKVALRRRQKERGSDGLNNDEKSGRDVHKVVVVPPPPPPPPGSDDQRIIIKGQDGQNNNNNIDNNKQNEQDKDEEYARNQLQKIQHAYEILSDDHNRLLYHKYGLIGGTDAAVQLLTGRATSASAAGGGVSNGGGIMNDGGAATTEKIRLLELMGYHHTHQSQHQYPSSSTSASHEQRIHTLTTTITEYLRPLVEGTISQDNFVSQIHSEMNTLKKSPLGAQILRCVGRAYKVEGWRILRQMREEKYRQRYGRSYSQTRHRHHSSRSKRNGQKNSRVDDILQDSWRSTKHYASAAYASGKLVLMEQKLKKLKEDRLRQKEERRRKKRMREEEDRLKRIQGSDESNHHVFSSNIGSLSDDEDEEFDIDSFSDIDLDNNNDSDSDMMMFSASESEDSDDDNDEIEYELQHIQNQKAYTALLSLHQMEALWKVTKIELDRTVREACRWILAPTPSSVPAIAGGGGRSEGGGWYAFCPSEQSPYQEDWQHYQASPPPPPPPPPPPSSSHHGEQHYQQRHHQHRRRLRQHQQQQRRPRQHSKADGWVGLNGQVVPMEVGRLRAAAAMVLVGDIMVRCSKEGTAWKKNK
ncbi:hypothetical protein QTG54_015157 [Skeletonema marinoi]|uniref:J domain-containing protein n=1 Tax=Skeletonema marinoi TaxID=267567 RepID=A0AAD8XUJ2_9STRA|nr:hypothetical protein QTG54_015157 [Skeletonema marinoi]